MTHQGQRPALAEIRKHVAGLDIELAGLLPSGCLLLARNPLPCWPACQFSGYQLDFLAFLFLFYCLAELY